MNIGFDAKRLFSNYTGLGNYSRSLVKNLQRIFPENDYCLYAPKLNKSPETAYYFNDKAFSLFEPNVVLKSWWRSFSMHRQLQKDRLDIYHGLSNELPVNIQKAGVKSVVTIHDLIFKTLPDTFPFIDRQIYNLKFRSSCRKADRIIAISESTKQDIVRFYNVDPQKIDVVYQSCNPLFYEPLTDKYFLKVQKQQNLPEQYLLFVGSVEKRKNIQLIIESYQHLKKEHQLPLLIVGGRRSYTREISALLRKHKIEDKIIWASRLDDNRDLQAIYQHAQALIYPSFYEGFGLPVVEALLSKTPVITSNVSSLPEAAGPHSLTVDPTNAKELAGAVEKVLDSSALQKNMIERGYDYALNNFSPEKTARDTMAVYRKAMEQQ